MSRGLGSGKCLNRRQLTGVASSSSPNFFQTITSELRPVEKDCFKKKKYLKKVFFGVHLKARPSQEADRNFLGLVAG